MNRFERGLFVVFLFTAMLVAPYISCALPLRNQHHHLKRRGSINR